MNAINQRFFEINHFSELTLVQQKVLDALPKHKDMVVKAQTGTGKTHAFLFSIMELIDPSLPQTQALILAPTRELAMQIHRFAKPLSELDERLVVELAIGGMDNSRISKKIAKQPHLIITTPGKFIDILSWNTLRLDFMRCCIIDEADMMLDYGFISEVDAIASQFMDSVSFMLYSATIPQGLRPFIRKYLHHPVEITIAEEEKFKPRIHHYLIDRKHLEIKEAVLDVLSGINPLLAVVFTNTKVEAIAVADYLRDFGIDCLEIHGDVSDRGRKQVLSRIINHDVKYIVATDLAARGIDLPEISHVINARLPHHDLSFYTHRAGRTGRSGREGYCINIVGQDDLGSVKRLIKTGYQFQFVRVKNQTLVETRPFYKLTSRVKELDPEIVQKLNRKTVQVKPGYRKKRKNEIQRLMDKKRRELIQGDIKKQKVARAKSKQKDVS